MTEETVGVHAHLGRAPAVTRLPPGPRPAPPGPRRVAAGVAVLAVLAALVSGVGVGSPASGSPAPASPATGGPGTGGPALGSSAPVSPAPGSTGSAATDHPVLVDVAAEVGLDHEHGAFRWDVSADPAAMMGGGACWLDADGDGWMDLYVVDTWAEAEHGRWVTEGGLPRSTLYRNDGGRFTDVGDATGSALEVRGQGCLAADLDGDGATDLYVTTARSNVLLWNDGDGTFTADDGVAGLDVYGWQTAAVATDLDGDGLLDVVVGGYVDVNTRLEGATGGFPRTHAPVRDLLLRNTGPGDGVRARFEEVGAAAGIDADGPRYTLGLLASDVDGDGDPDLLVANDTDPNRLYRNDSTPGRIVLVDVAASAGADDDNSGMGIAGGDVDGDGTADLLVTNMGLQRHTLLGNRTPTGGPIAYADLRGPMGVTELGEGLTGWGVSLADLDLDADLDVVIANGAIPVTDPAADAQRVVVYESAGGVLADRSTAWGTDDVAPRVGRGQAVADYDNDGDPDVVVVGLGGRLALLENRGATGGWLVVDVAGSPPGTRVVADLPTGHRLVREIHAGSSYLSTEDPRVLLGLGRAAQVDRLEVRTPDGRLTVLHDVAAGQVVHVDPGGDDAAPAGGGVPGGGFPGGGGAGPAVPGGGGAGAAVPGGGGAGAAVPGVGAAPGGGASGADGRPAAGTALGGRGAATSTTPAPLPPDRVAEVACPTGGSPLGGEGSVAHAFVGQALDAIRRDLPAPTVHARNLHHLSVALWDAWAAYEPGVVGLMSRRDAPPLLRAGDVARARHVTMARAAHDVLAARYADAVGAEATMQDLAALLAATCRPVGLPGHLADRLGQAVAGDVLAATVDDGAARGEEGPPPVNPPMRVAEPGTTMVDPDRWQPLALDAMVSQNGIPLDATVQEPLGPRWGHVDGFALPPAADGLPLDPGPPPRLTDPDRGEELRAQVVEVLRASAHLDPADGVLVDASPASRGGSTLGTDDGRGHPVNPATGRPYAPAVVPRADLDRVLAEFWADGPTSETPPGHWNTIAGEVSDAVAPQDRRIGGAGPPVDRLTWDVHLYLALNGALHDAAVAAWGVKAAYDSSRPISLVRHMGGLGQSSDPDGPGHHPDGLPLVEGLVEVVTAASSVAGGRHEALAGHVGEVAVRTWTPGVAVAGDPQARVRWIRAVEWVPYQRSTFVTPAFPGYVSGHSTFSRAAAEVLAAITASPWFPGGLFTVTVPAGGLVFEDGPTVDVPLQWATYADAADQAGRSRIHGGIHISADDHAGRRLGAAVGQAAWRRALEVFRGVAGP